MGRVRSAIPRSRVPWHRRVLMDPAAIRHWIVVGLLALAAGGLVARAIDQAGDAERRWGETRSVLVADRSVHVGDELSEAVRSVRWPASLVPPNAVDRVLRGARAATELDEGAPLTESALTGTTEAGVDGERRTIALPAPEAHLPLERGDLVDVWASVDPSLAAEGDLPTSRIAAGARVIASSRRAVVVSVDRDEVAAVAEALSIATITLAATG